MAHLLVDLLGGNDNDMMIKIYKKMAKEQIKEIAKWAKKSTIDVDKVDEMCKKYTKEEIYKLARKNKLVSENMSKREVCLSLEQILK